MEARIPSLPSRRRPSPLARRIVDFADPALWVWFAVVVMIVVPCAVTLA
jgi:hypothetical protein